MPLTSVKFPPYLHAGYRLAEFVLIPLHCGHNSSLSRIALSCFSSFSFIRCIIAFDPMTAPQFPHLINSSSKRTTGEASPGPFSRVIHASGQMSEQSQHESHISCRKSNRILSSPSTYSALVVHSAAHNAHPVHLDTSMVKCPFCGNTPFGTTMLKRSRRLIPVPGNFEPPLFMLRRFFRCLRQYIQVFQGYDE